MLTPAQFEDYCSSIKDTATWGGEPEIVALSGAFKIPIHIVQGGKPSIVVHEPIGERTSNDVLRISYHRKLYGLGEVSDRGLYETLIFKGSISIITRYDLREGVFMTIC